MENRNERELRNERNERELGNERNERDNETDRTDHETRETDNAGIERTKMILFNNGWNDKNEKLIVSIGENAASYKWMHDRAFRIYTNLNRIASMLIVCGNAVLTAQSAFQGTYTECEATFFQKILIYIVTALSIIYNFLRFQEIATNHQNAIKNFGELYHDIQQQMCLYRKDRVKANKYIQSIMRKYDNLTSDSPKIPELVVYLFKREYRHSDIALPDIIDKIHKIDINNEFNVKNNIKDPSKKVCNLSKLTNISKENEKESEDFEHYLQIQAKDARVRYEFDRWNALV
jgi:hypothetical protein